jgi:hypothetical protein
MVESTSHSVINIIVTVLRLDLRVVVLTDVKNNGTRETRGFRQVQPSLRIKILCPVTSVYYDCLGWDPLYSSFYRLRGVGFTWKIWSVRVVPDPDSISTCPIYKIRFHNYLLNRLGYGFLARAFRPSGPTLGRPPVPFVSGEGLPRNWMILLGHRRLQYIGRKP